MISTRVRFCKRKLDGLALQVFVDDAENVRLALVDAQSVALQREDIAVFGDDDGDADIDVRQQSKIVIVDDASGLAYISGSRAALRWTERC